MAKGKQPQLDGCVHMLTNSNKYTKINLEKESERFQRVIAAFDEMKKDIAKAKSVSVTDNNFGKYVILGKHIFWQACLLVISFEAGENWHQS